MELKEQKISTSLAALLQFLLILADFRWGKEVNEVMIFRTQFGETGYYVCPRCHITMEREFMSFCDRCGQHLDWTDYKKAKRVYPGQKS